MKVGAGVEGYAAAEGADASAFFSRALWRAVCCWSDRLSAKRFAHVVVDLSSRLDPHDAHERVGLRVERLVLGAARDQGV